MMGAGNDSGITFRRWSSSRPTITSFLIAEEMTAFVFVSLLPAFKVTGTTQSVGTGSPDTLIYFMRGFSPVICIRSHFATFDAIRVAADPVSGNESKENEPSSCEILRGSLFYTSASELEPESPLRFNIRTGLSPPCPLFLILSRMTVKQTLAHRAFGSILFHVALLGAV